MQLFTAGYQNRNITQDILGFQGVLVDIRQNPFVKNPQWTLETLQEVFGDRYFHPRELGNKVYWTDRIEIIDLPKGISYIIRFLEFSDVLLLCCCANLLTCHRKIIADTIEQQHRIKTIHLGHE
jgi:uncharacterized protein (DUF488 family)